MESTAKLQHVKMSAQKARLVANDIRGVEIKKAIEYLDFHKKKAAISIKNVLNSAIANAEHNDGADIDELVVSKIYVNEGPTSKRMRPRAKGRGNRILQRSCHISVEVSDKKRQP